MSNMTLQDVIEHCTEEYGNVRLDVVANEDGSWTAQLWAQRVMAGSDAACGHGEHVGMALDLMVEDYCEREWIR